MLNENKQKKNERDFCLKKNTQKQNQVRFQWNIP